MTGPKATNVDAGLCATCVHAKAIESSRGSTFLLCRRSSSDPRFPRYPMLPVTRCPGYESPPARSEE